ncbi:MAG TPA: cupin domain-containing protein [Burkholderiaceae bacterium]|nr:cupin domain-containing protein [Burkholderiaceae bacterium]
MRASAVVLALSATSIPLAAAAQDHHATVKAEELKWTAPAAYAKGAQLAVVRGDPSKEGMYVVRLKVPAGFRIAPHSHPNDENVTVLSGTFNIGTGDRFDESKGTRIRPGGYSFVMKGMTHYAWFPEETVIQLHGMGPQGITYVNPSDDPRKQ